MYHRLIQLTDCHLGTKTGDTLLGLDADLSLGYVLEQLQLDYPCLDALVCSGDLSNESNCSKPYQRLTQALTAYPAQYWLPGNHDNNQLMQESLDATQQFLGDFSLGAWHITLLDTSITGKVSGLLAQEELERATTILESFPDKYHLMFTHHHLLPVGSAWIDQQKTANADAALQTLMQYPQLKVLACGHVHQQSQQQHAHIHLYSTPSTCIQFKTQSENFAVSDEMPGFRWFHLYDDGHYQTGVTRIKHKNLPIDLQSQGY